MGRSASARTQSDPAVALVETLEGILRGRCVVIDRFDANGRRYLVVARCRSEEVHPRALSAREAEVVLLAIRGETHKRIAYELRLSRSSVTKLLRSALAKLQLRSQAQLVSELSCFVRLARSMDANWHMTQVALTSCHRGRPKR
jgi:DNA-binding NarL/FixJ family response regulator